MFTLCMCSLSPGTPAFYHHSKTHVRLIGDSELSLGVSVSVDGCLSLCGPVTAGIGSGPPHNPELD